MKKVVLNKCFGGFGLSPKAYEFLGMPWDGYGFAYENRRDDPKLVECVEVLGEEANGMYAELVVEEYDDYNYTHRIGEYDGWESLVLSPIVHTSKIESMTSDEIIEYLITLGIQIVFDEEELI